MVTTEISAEILGMWEGLRQWATWAKLTAYASIKTNPGTEFCEPTIPLHLRVVLPNTVGPRVECDSKLLFIFDLDETLAKNCVISSEMVAQLHQLRHNGVVLALCSFNRGSLVVLRANGVLDLFTTVAFGWTPVGASKGAYVTCIFQSIGWEGKCPEDRYVAFFDDLVENCDDVASVHPAVETVHVTSPDDTLQLIPKTLAKAKNGPEDKET